jgi:hypothetical protein
MIKDILHFDSVWEFGVYVNGIRVRGIGWIAMTLGDSFEIPNHYEVLHNAL